MSENRSYFRNMTENNFTREEVLGFMKQKVGRSCCFNFNLAIILAAKICIDKWSKKCQMKFIVGQSRVRDTGLVRGTEGAGSRDGRSSSGQ